MIMTPSKPEVVRVGVKVGKSRDRVKIMLLFSLIRHSVYIASNLYSCQASVPCTSNAFLSPAITRGRLGPMTAVQRGWVACPGCPRLAFPPRPPTREPCRARVVTRPILARLTSSLPRSLVNVPLVVGSIRPDHHGRAWGAHGPRRRVFSEPARVRQLLPILS